MGAPADATCDAPGTGYDPKGDDTALQRHVTFFDKDRDGVIWIRDTMLAFRELGFGYFWMIFGAFAIHFTLSWLTWGSVIPDPFFGLYVRRIHKAKHGSDTEIYTTTGTFDEKRFNDMFEMYSKEPHTHMTFLEAMKMVKGDMDPFDVFGWVCAIFEWVTTYILLDPVDGKMKKEDIKAVYNGSIFWKLADKNKNKTQKAQKKGT